MASGVVRSEVHCKAVDLEARCMVGRPLRLAVGIVSGLLLLSSPGLAQTWGQSLRCDDKTVFLARCRARALHLKFPRERSTQGRTQHLVNRRGGGLTPQGTVSAVQFDRG